MLPYLIWSGTTAIILSLVVSAIGLFIIGAAITLMTGKSIWFSGTRQVLVGIAAAALTFGIGKLIGISVG
jgi:VIT1/CCC1 family predicted Fe2+/Mn2+ transporter